VLLAKQTVFRILCDTKHEKKEMLLSKLKEFSRVNDELQVLLGKSKATILKDHRDHRQIEVSIKEKKKLKLCQIKRRRISHMKKCMEK